MSKLTAKYDIRADGSKNIKGYNISFKKSDIEALGWNKDTKVTIKIIKDKIEIKEGE